MILRQLLDQVKIENVAGTQINPATSENIAQLEALLTQIYGAVDGLELSADNIDINTDELEDKVQSVRDQLDVVLSSRVSETTGQSILNALGEISGTDLVSELQNLVAKDFATETTLSTVASYLDTVEEKLQFISDRFDVQLSTRASESTVAEIRDTIGQESGKTVLGEIDDLTNKDFSTETTLSAVLSQLDITLSALRDAIKGTNNKDLSTLETDIEAILARLDVQLSTRATESTLTSLLNATGEGSGTSLLNELQSILTTLNTILSTKATEATLIQVRDYLDTVETKLQTLIDKDFATEATSTAILNTVGQESGNTVLSKLEELIIELNELDYDSLSKALKVIAPDHSKIHDGKAFHFATHEIIVKDASHDLLIINPISNYPHVRFFTINTENAPGQFYLYEGTTVSANGTAENLYNSKRSSIITPNLSIYSAPTITADGTIIDSDTLTGTKSSGGILNENGHEWILKENTNYLVRYTNLSGVDTKVTIRLFFYEN